MEEYLEKIIKGRRSISEFSDREISNEIIDELIDLASFAPSSTNTQPWFFLIFKSEENKKRLNDFIALGYEKLKTQLKDNNIIS
jgi:nitroreductase